MSGAGFVHRVGFPYGIRYAPRWLVSSWYKRELVGRLDLSDEERLKLFLASASKAHETERDIYTDADFWRLVIRSSREAFAQGYDAVSEDAKVMCDDFGFRVQDIRKDLPVQLWYGKHDTFVPANHGVQIAARLGGRAQLRVEDEGHAGIGIHWKKEILEGLLRNM
jgi:pimeloyl-ACP methyl ester carboxylesterase